MDELRVEEIIRKVVEVARTGRMGDGKILVLSAAFPNAIDIAENQAVEK